MKTGKKQPKDTSAQTGKKSTEEKPGGRKNAGIPLVAIGASAGGLEAIESFFSNVPAQSGMAFVVVQHFAPGHRSMMDAILAKHTAIEIAMIEDGMLIAPNMIYLQPSGHNTGISEDRFHLSEAGNIRAENLPIDHFFRSLAESRKEKAVCVVLSGTGTDGTQGMKAIKAVGGMAMAQEERQAKYSGMPKSAIDTGLVDFVLPVEKMPEAIAKYIQHPLISRIQAPPPKPHAETEGALKKVFVLLKSTTGHDFSEYKQTTIRRRIERRMAVNAVDSMVDYAKLLERDQNELELLFGDMLISVTRFFRDPEAYEALARMAVPAILSSKTGGSELRIWVVGCATGEEAYSLAILLTEMIEETGKRIDVQVFASDIDARAIEHARKGIYPAGIAQDVSEQRLERFFIQTDSVYRIKKSIRDRVVFALHDVTKDPQFSRIDLLSCRNMLIYMNRELQARVLPVFHYSLADNGVLFLGSSESVGDLAGDFRTMDSRNKIYQKVGTVSPAATAHMHERVANSQTAPHPAKAVAPVKTLGERILVENFSPPAVLVTERMEVRHIYGEVEPFLTFASGEASLNVLQIARNGIRPRLAASLAQAIRENTQVTAQQVSIKSGDSVLMLDIVVHPIYEPGQAQRLMLVVFKEKDRRRNKEKKGNPDVPAEERVDETDALAQELKATKEYLQTTIEELQTSNEELRSTNEELQSTNEELESSREELQSTNEELSTVNSELQNNVEELTQRSNDLNNLLSSTDIATIFLDTELRIKRFTPTTVKVFRLQEGDIGRPIGDITSKIVSSNIYQVAAEVLDTLVRKDIEVVAEDERWYMVSVLPYRTLDFTIEGVVLTFSEITDLKRALREYESAEKLATGIVNSMRTPFVVLDNELIVKAASDPFYDFFSVRPEETIDRPIHELGSGQWNIEVLRRALEEIVEGNKPLENYPVECDFPQIGHRKMHLNGRQIERTKYVYLSIESVREHDT